MAQYKVPQDVEAEDKLLGPFSFRQFVYLLIAAGCIALMVGLFQLFPVLAIFPLLPALLFLALALPLKKDQPMEMYLAALVSYYLKPRTRKWMPGQKESTILITAPKVVEETRTRDLSEEEATHRLSFLADIVDTEGYAIRGMATTSMREDLVAEANATADMFDVYESANLSQAIQNEQAERREEAIKGMRDAINRAEIATGVASWEDIAERRAREKVKEESVQVRKPAEQIEQVLGQGAEEQKEKRRKQAEELAAVEVVVRPDFNLLKKDEAPAQTTTLPHKKQEKGVKRSIIELANNKDYTIQTIQHEANRINRKEDGEVFISLH